MDTVTVNSKTSALVSPKVAKTKAAPPSTSSTVPAVSFGCDHVQSLLNPETRKTALQQHALIQQTVFDRRNASQTHKSRAPDGRPVTSLIPAYLCLQCSMIITPENREKHYETKKHVFYIESRSGCLYCRQCRDFVYDPTLEAARLQRGRKKRSFDEMNNPEDQKLVGVNSTFIPCRATGLRGLYNMGQTCFMSVIMQSLIHNPIIRSYYLSEGHRQSDCDRDKEDCTSCGIDDIFSEFFSSEKAEGFGAVNMLVSSWRGSSTLAGYQQQDAHEYMQFILNSLHLANTNADSPTGLDNTDSSACPCIIHRAFSGQLASTVTCSSCHNTTTAIDPFLDLSLDIRQRAKKKKGDKSSEPNGDTPSSSSLHTLQSSLARFTSPELLPATSYKCSHCASSSSSATAAAATKRLLIRGLPPVLAIHLKRFEHGAGPASGNGANGTSQSGGGGNSKAGGASSGAKIEERVAFPLMLDAAPYTVRGAGQGGAEEKEKIKKEEKDKKERDGKEEKDGKDGEEAEALYSLSSVVVHKGRMESGHYVSYAREGNEWFMFDDAKVTMVGEREVLGAEAYLLFYVAQRV
ncbi:MAG: hypothetical protein M1821_004281 [Bathelium mastoideum]|nr:MAG: hypothetical protein M1821_004281 [Bathelium mastoideum]